MSREELLPVAIVGGGPVGMALALALHKQDIAAEIFDERERGAGLKDRRTLALSHGSRQTLEWLGAWQGIDATAAGKRWNGWGRGRASTRRQSIASTSPTAITPAGP